MAQDGSNIIPFDDAWRRSSSRARSSYRDSYRTEESSRRVRRQSFGRDFVGSHQDSQESAARPSREAFPVLDGEFPADPAWLDRIDGGAEPRPRAAVEVYDQDSFDEEDQDVRGRSKAERKKKQKAKAKAEKLFMRQFGGSSGASDGAEGGSRAALYKGEMGRGHKRAFQDLNDSARSRKKTESKPGRTPKEQSSGLPKLTIAAVILGLVVFAAVFLYSPARQYYLEMRANDQLQAEYDALNERNKAIQEEIDYLSTDEGVQDEAREQLGWVQEGEVAVVVEGLEEEPEKEPVRAQVLSGSVPAPATWYSPMLDMIFGFNDGTGADTSRQEAAATVDDAGVQEAQEAEAAQAEANQDAQGQDESAKQE